MEYTATAKYVRMSPRKVRLVARAIAGKRLVFALTALSSMPKAAAEPLKKLIASALANSQAKKAKADMLIVFAIDVMEGPVMKRWHAVSKGTAHPYKKRMSHVKVILKEEENLPSGKEGK